MASESKEARQHNRKQQILRATLRLLRKHGAGISTAQIAAEASCSKETLYNWFGDRDGILTALVHEQAEGMNDALTRGFESFDGSAEEQLCSGATLLLDIMTGDAVLAVNRIAMAQACQECSDLGQTVLKDWEEQVKRPLFALFESLKSEGKIAFSDRDEAFEIFLGLLVGDRQRRLLLGENSRPSANKMPMLARETVSQWMALHAV